MCYDVSLRAKTKEVIDYFPEQEFINQLEFDFDGTHIIGHAYPEHPIVYQNREDNKLHLQMMEWGCIPFYIKDLDGFKRQRATHPLLVFRKMKESFVGVERRKSAAASPTKRIVPSPIFEFP